MTDDVDEACQAQIKLLRDHPLVPDEVSIHEYVYEVESDALRRPGEHVASVAPAATERRTCGHTRRLCDRTLNYPRRSERLTADCTGSYRIMLDNVKSCRIKSDHIESALDPDRQDSRDLLPELSSLESPRYGGSTDVNQQRGRSTASIDYDIR